MDFIWVLSCDEFPGSIGFFPTIEEAKKAIKELVPNFDFEAYFEGEDDDARSWEMPKTVGTYQRHPMLSLERYEFNKIFYPNGITDFI